MKKSFKATCVGMSMAILMAVAVGCSNGSYEEPETGADETKIVTEAAKNETEAVTTEEVNVQESSEDTVVDISNAREITSAEEPANLGEWVKSTRYSAASNKDEVVYWRVVDTTFDCQGEIDEYNSKDKLYVFEPLENPDLKYCMVSYEVYFPEEYPAEEWGISSADLKLSAKNPNGGGIEYNGVAYIGLGTCKDISNDAELFPGDVFKGEAIYAMIDDPSINYVFEYRHEVEGQDGLVSDYVASK